MGPFNPIRFQSNLFLRVSYDPSKPDPPKKSGYGPPKSGDKSDLIETHQIFFEHFETPVPDKSLKIRIRIRNFASLIHPARSITKISKFRGLGRKIIERASDQARNSTSYGWIHST